MPFYEYQCKSCGHDLEAMQKITELPLKKCPHCGKAQLQRLMSAPVFRLKGGGWYETDFKGDKENQRNLADRPEADAPKDGGKDAAKEGTAAGADAKAADGAGVKDAAPKEKAGDKPAEKAPVESVKAASSGSGRNVARGRTAARGKSPAKRPVKKPAPKKAKGRR